MEQLIWFSVPGAIAIFALALLSPVVANAHPSILITSAPVLGFVLHQTYRTLFETSRGWESTRRPVLGRIREAYRIAVTERHAPFLVWETAFYSGEIPPSFRDHNRAAWHYVMSFRSVAFVAGLSTAALGVGALSSTDLPPLAALIGCPAISLTFWLKGRLTYLSLTRQEVAAFSAYRPAFDKVWDTLVSDVSPNSSGSAKVDGERPPAITPKPTYAAIDERYGFALQLIQYEISRLWTIYGLFLLAETVLLSAVAQVFHEEELVYAGSAVGLLMLFPWWATFENTRNFYLLRLMQAKDFEPKVGSFLTEGHLLATGEEITRKREGGIEERVKMNSVIALMRPQHSGWFLMLLFAGSFIGISVLQWLSPDPLVSP